jgi:hypothetical protein
MPGHEGVALAGEATCLSCHGIKFAGILPGWLEEVEVRLESVSGAVGRVRRGLGSHPGALADSLLDAAEENLELVRVGKGVHNIPFADELLRAAVRMAREAAEAGRIDPGLASVNLGAPMEVGSCTSCHYGVDGGGQVTWQGRVFPHRRHTVNAGLDCQVCHTPFAEHGGLTVASTDGCDNCHHISDSPQACGLCHPAPSGDTLAVGSKTFLHDPHLAMGFACNLCHQAPAMSVEEESCNTCHEIHHGSDTNCSFCHSEAPRDLVATEIGQFPHEPHIDMGFDCATCHKEPGSGADLEACATCHSLHHQLSADCRLCHTESPREKHLAEVVHTMECTTCHTAPDQAALTELSRNVCLVCHGEVEEHSGGMECSLCHEFPHLGENHERPGEAV